MLQKRSGHSRVRAGRVSPQAVTPTLVGPPQHEAQAASHPTRGLSEASHNLARGTLRDPWRGGQPRHSVTTRPRDQSTARKPSGREQSLQSSGGTKPSKTKCDRARRRRGSRDQIVEVMSCIAGHLILISLLPGVMAGLRAAWGRDWLIV